MDEAEVEVDECVMRREPTNDTMSFETTKTADTDISMPSHIKIPNLPAIADIVEAINAIDEEAPRSIEDGNLNSSTQQHVVDVVEVSNAKRQTDEFGFFVDTIDATPPAQLTSKEKKEIKAAESEWLHLLDNWQSLSLKNKSKIKKLSRKGIPESLRGRAWIGLTGSNRRLEKGKFQTLCARAATEDRPSIFDVIDRDVNRCFPTHVMFADENGEGQQNIRKILQSYALYNPTLGYCQGMGMLVGILLMRMSVEDAFWTLVVILDLYMPDYHSVTLYQLRVDAAAFDVCLRKFARPLHRHMVELAPLTYVTQWFLTVYIMAMPWKTVLRVWDMFLHDGPKALFRAGLAILKRNKNILLKQCPLPSDLLEHLIMAPRAVTDSSKFIDECLRINLGHKQLEKIRDQVKRAHASLENIGTKRTAVA